MKNKNLEYRMQNIECRIKVKDNNANHKFYQHTANKTAFTLVELIVTIVILAILGTIAFISFQGYSKNSRDSVRIADINSTKKSLEIFITKAGFYPTPDNGTNIIYSGATVWTEGTIGANVIKNIQSVSKVITDPLTSNEYTYSITSSKKEYQIGAISEGGGLTQSITNNAYATDLSKTSAVAYITGNYNEKFTKVNTGAISWILAQPSIIVSDIGNPDLGNILSNKKLTYNNYGSYPHSYNQNSTGGFDYNKPTQIIYSGSLLDLHDVNSNKLDFITNLQDAYSGTVLATNPIYEEIMGADPINDSTGAINIVNTYIISNKGGIKLKEVTLLGDNSTGGESGGGEINFYTSCTGQNTPIPFSATTTYNGCDKADIIVCAGNGSGYTISSCNVGATIAGTGIASYGNIYQFGKSDISFSAGISSYSYDWKSPGGTDAGSANDWGVLDDNTNTATWLNSDSISRIKMQGPCANGYHIPTNAEWSGIANAGGWSWGDGSRISNTLKLPMSGYSNWDDGTIYNQGTEGGCWSSSPNGNGANYLKFDSGSLYPNDFRQRSFGFNIRCIKN
ncbi:MAG: prepilin-type N-terminal cleavage/methylation domain-containing protein [Candidatus Gracilibacteria bacterium]|nr:prepilin-type N-terminal cleavage/methylation domain-containing protein [Candidatus Gracilibacteria bacterium]